MSRTIAKWIRDAKYHFCAACGREDDLQYHHLVPIALGGSNTPDNIIVLCAGCHQKWHMQNGREHHNYLVKEGIAKAKERGVKFGKKSADYENVMRLIAKHSTQFNNIYDLDFDMKTESEIMDLACVKGVCYAKCKNMLKEAMSAPEWPYEWDKPAECKKRPLYDRVINHMRGAAS